MASIIDITERKRAEERLRLIIEASPNGMIMVGREGKITLVNSQIEKLFGYTREELLGQTIEMLVPERFRSKHPGYRDSFFADPKARAMGAGRDLFGLKKDGTELPIEIGLNPIETAEGVFTLASVIDITERKRTETLAREKMKLEIEMSERKRIEKIIRASEARYRAVLKSALDGIITADIEGNIISWNKGAQTIFGYSEEEVLGKPLTILMPERYRNPHEKGLEHFRRTGEGPVIGKVVELAGLRKDGSEFPLELSISSWKKEEEETFFTAIVRDITERKQAEEEVLKFLRAVEQSASVVMITDIKGKVVSVI